MGPTGGLLLICSLCCCYCTARPTSSSSPAEQPSCTDPASTQVCFEPSVPYKVVLRAGETAVLRCVIRNLDKQVVTWMKNDGRDIPLTIGQSVFTPDARVTLDNSAHDEWNLVISLAEVKDSGEYLCQVNGRAGLMARAYGLVVEESETPKRPQPSAADKTDQKGDKRLLSDDQEARSRARSSSVSISGEGTVFEGALYFPLTCTARFGTRDAKASPRVSIEWYHQGLQQTVNVSSMDISMSWADSDRAISVLTIYRVQMSHTGDWVCLKRPSELGSMETATHTLTVLAREPSAAKVNAAIAADTAPASSAVASLGTREDLPNSGERSRATMTSSPPGLLSAATAALLAVSLNHRFC